MLSRPEPGAKASERRARSGRPPAERSTRLKRIAYGTGGVLGFAALSQIVAWTGLIEERYLPSASTVAVEAVELILRPSFLADVGSTLAGWFLALLIASAISIPFGILLGSSRISYLASSSIINLIRPIPAVALIPLAALVWGNGIWMKVGLTVFGIVWPILFNTIYGVRDVEPVAKETAQTFGIRGLGIFKLVVLPSAAPFILTGIRVAASLGLVIVVGTELFAGSNSGIGAYILAATTGGGDTTTVIAGALWAGVLGVTINAILGAVDRRYFRWARKGADS